jgi:GNAT superfamily N-acetyltransferase
MSPKNKMNVRPATEYDIAMMSSIRLAVTENALSDPRKITEQMYKDYLDVRGRTWVAELDESIIGFCAADKDTSSIWALFIHPGHESKGAASALLQLAVEWLFIQGKQAVVLSTAAHTRADRFYAARGWKREVINDSTEVRYELLKDSR